MDIKITIQENIIYSLSFLLQDILFPISGYFNTFNPDNPGILSYEPSGDVWVGGLNEKNWMYVNPVTIYPKMYDRFSRLLDVSRDESDYLTNVELTPPNDGKVFCKDFVNSNIVFNSQPDGSFLESYFSNKVINFLTQIPEDTENIVAPTFALVYNSEVGKPAEISSTREFNRYSFSFVVWGRNDTEVVSIGSIIRNSLRVSIPVIDFNNSDFPLKPKTTDGSGMEPNETFDPVANTIKWANLKEVNFNVVGVPGIPGSDRHKGIGTILLEIMR